MRSPLRLLGSAAAVAVSLVLLAAPAQAAVTAGSTVVAEQPPTPAPPKDSAPKDPAPTPAPPEARKRAAAQAEVRAAEQAKAQQRPAETATPAPAPSGRPRTGQPATVPADPAPVGALDDRQVTRVPVGGADTGGGAVAEEGTDAALLVGLGVLAVAGAAGAVALQRAQRKG
jgi:outer membrane biosynthesis protein TonB